MGDKVENNVRLAAREIVSYAHKGITLTPEEFGQVYERHNIQTEDEFVKTAMEIRDQGREYIRQLVERKQLGILGKLMMAKLDVMDTLILVRHKIRQNIGR
jgi:hypothetical protein